MAEANSNVAAVSLKLPVFSKTSPNVWFAQAEAQFGIRNITIDQTKYNYVVAALDEIAANRIAHVILHPPIEGTYEHLKTALLACYDFTEEEAASKLEDLDGLGDRRPSDMLAHMLMLNGNNQVGTIFRERFLRQLPDDVRVTLAALQLKDVDAIAATADAVMVVRGQSHLCAVDNLSTMTLSAKTKRRQLTTARDDICWYHAKFGSRAKKCRAPCSFSGNEQTSHETRQVQLVYRAASYTFGTVTLAIASLSIREQKSAFFPPRHVIDGNDNEVNLSLLQTARKLRLTARKLFH